MGGRIALGIVRLLHGARLLHEVHGFGKSAGVVVGQRAHLGKFHEIGNFENLLHAFVGHAGSLVLAEYTGDLLRGHLHGVDAEAALQIIAEDVGKPGIIFFFLAVLPEILATEMLQTLHCQLMRIR